MKAFAAVVAGNGVGRVNRLALDEEAVVGEQRDTRAVHQVDAEIGHLVDATPVEAAHFGFPLGWIEGLPDKTRDPAAPVDIIHQDVVEMEGDDVLRSSGKNEALRWVSLQAFPCFCDGLLDNEEQMDGNRRVWQTNTGDAINPDRHIGLRRTPGQMFFAGECRRE
jgi:hypothetical protein